jgi:hypothetical protein
MQTPETAKAAHPEGGGPREFEHLGGRLDQMNTANGSIPQARAVSNTFDHRALTADTISSTPEQGSAPSAPTPPRPSYAVRLAAKAVSKAKTGTCRECNAGFQAQRTTREFCCTGCRRAFNNRRMLRGLLALDLVMAHRFDRKAFEAAGGRKLLSRLASIYRAEDDRDRSGRKSWDDLAKVLERNPYLSATVVETNVAGTRRPGGHR